MQKFTELFIALDSTTKTSEKINLLSTYFSQASTYDAIWALFFLSGRRLKQLVQTKKLREWALELIQLPLWLFEDSYEAVGDLAETIALLLPANNNAQDTMSLHEWVEQKLLKLRKAPEDEQKAIIFSAWQLFTPESCFIWNKLILGNFRVGVSQPLIIKALAKFTNLPENVLAHRLMGQWEPTEHFWYELIHPDILQNNYSRPYPFYLAYPLTSTIDTLGDIDQWQVEWKWDGIRAQIIKRDQQLFIWSRGEELINESFPELMEAAAALPEGTVIDGEILPWQMEPDRVGEFAQLQRRITRKKLTKRLLQEVPIIFIAFDILEYKGSDLRQENLRERRLNLINLFTQLNASCALRLSTPLNVNNWEQVRQLQASARTHKVEGVMLKYLNGAYLTGRKRGEWWKWKIDPYTIDAVLIAAQRGHGKRSSLYTDYTFGLWAGEKLVSFTKAYSGLTDEELHQVDAFIRRNTVERFGPVRTVKPKLVFELAFEGIQRSTRHKSGFAVRFPRILRQRLDKTIEQADSLTNLETLLTQGN